MYSIWYSIIGAPPSVSGIFHDKSQWLGPQSSMFGFPGGLGSSVIILQNLCYEFVFQSPWLNKIFQARMVFKSFPTPRILDTYVITQHFTWIRWSELIGSSNSEPISMLIG